MVLKRLKTPELDSPILFIEFSLIRKPEDNRNLFVLSKIRINRCQNSSESNV